ncbi:hypothetical protein X772_24880 [Mesorhizobium sp. LSJC280B00]|nr:hypothetical protein X772_24880 [Mesorhizobium sp. LSJC280B00]
MPTQDNFIVVALSQDATNLPKFLPWYKTVMKSSSKELVLHILLCKQSQILTGRGVNSW